RVLSDRVALLATGNTVAQPHSRSAGDCQCPARACVEGDCACAADRLSCLRLAHPAGARRRKGSPLAESVVARVPVVRHGGAVSSDETAPVVSRYSVVDSQWRDAGSRDLAVLAAPRLAVRTVD